MIKAIAIVTLAACGGAKSASTLSNPGAESTTDAAMAAEEIEGKPTDDNTIAGRQAIEQARAADILRASPQADTATEPVLDKTAIRTQVRTRIVSIQICYERQLLDKPTLAGTTLVDFTIGADGSVAAASGTGFDAAVDGCVAGVIKQITFPKPAAGKMSVKYPFTFKPAS